MRPLKFALIAVSALIYALAFPNPVFTEGLAPAAWAAYIGVFIVIAKTTVSAAPAWGALFGALSITLSNYWLSFFHPLAGIISAALFALYFALLFLLLKCAARFLPECAPLVMTALWVGMEYLSTLGFLGYPYAVTGYTQWKVLPLIKAADLAGVWIISALIIFPQALVVWRLLMWKSLSKSPHVKFLLAWLASAFVLVGYGFISKPDWAYDRTRKISLIQPNSDPWKADIIDFRKELQTLRKLSDTALAEDPVPDLIVWPETAFVPSFYYHDRYRVDPDSTALVLEARDYLKSKKVPFVVGNNEGRELDGEEGRRVVSYNAALVFEGGQWVGRYYKMKLVPFTETFPYKKTFPKIYDFLAGEDTHFWEPGMEPVVLNAASMKFAAPICFEDAFGGYVREFALGGAEVFVNLSNDSWAHSAAAQYRHLSASVFRAVENGRAMVRSTASGQTCAIGPDGSILAMAEPFEEAVLSVDVPLRNSKTLYTRAGDWFPPGLAIAALLLVVFNFVRRLLKRKRYAPAAPPAASSANELEEIAEL